jgi:hypothetical protein
MASIQSWEDIVTAATAVANEVEQQFGKLTASQVNWKPSAEKWSVGQCFDHLMVTNRAYFPILQEILQGTKVNTFWQQLPIWPWIVGKIFIKAVQSQQKVSAPKSLLPSKSELPGDTIAQFIAHQKQVIDLMRQTAQKVDLRQVIIASPLSPVVVLSLWDAYQVVISHERRHFRQAVRVMESAGFPS